MADDLRTRLRQHHDDLVKPGGTNATELRADLLAAEQRIATLEQERDELEQSREDVLRAWNQATEDRDDAKERGDAAESRLTAQEAENATLRAEAEVYAQRWSATVAVLDREVQARAEAEQREQALRAELAAAERRIVDLCQSHEEQFIARERAEHGLGKLTDALMQFKRSVSVYEHSSDGLTHTFSTRTADAVLWEDIDDLSDARAMELAEAERRAFEAGWEAGAQFEHDSLTKDIERDTDAAYRAYLTRQPGEA